MSHGMGAAVAVSAGGRLGSTSRQKGGSYIGVSNWSQRLGVGGGTQRLQRVVAIFALRRKKPFARLSKSGRLERTQDKSATDLDVRTSLQLSVATDSQ